MDCPTKTIPMRFTDGMKEIREMLRADSKAVEEYEDLQEVARRMRECADWIDDLL